MKQAEDEKTIDLISEPKKRGRPSTGKAMSAAKRKRNQRARDMGEALTFESMENITTSGLLALMANAGLRESIGEMAWREFGKRNGFKV